MNSLKLSFLLVVIFFISCNSPEKDVYVVGAETNSDHKWSATLWKNGASQNLTDASSYGTNAGSVYVFGKDVYVVGTECFGGEKYGMSFAILWKNGVRQNLTDGKSGAGANSVFVSKNNVYVAGWEKNALGIAVAKLWKNGVPQSITNGSYDSWAEFVYVAENNDVYVVVEERNPQNTNDKVLYKNGVQSNLPKGTNSIFILGRDVYAVGERSNERGYATARLWKNGEEQYLEQGRATIARKVFVSGKDVYVIGEESYEIDVTNLSEDDIRLRGRKKDDKYKPTYWAATIWKNGKKQNLSNNNYDSYAYSIYVQGKDVYVVGAECNAKHGWIGVVKLWKNGVPQNLSDGSYTSIAHSVFVK